MFLEKVQCFWRNVQRFWRNVQRFWRNVQRFSTYLGKRLSQKSFYLLDNVFLTKKTVKVVKAKSAKSL